ncbi:ATP-grasp domain-containing protein [Hydrogenophaga sp. BPS33]|nr:ATP-grasp domain-containing protein [Hydrogenophaga sp. BPS33]
MRDFTGATPRNVLISSAANKIPLLRSVMQAARRIDTHIRVFAGDASDGVTSRYFADGFIQLPRTQTENADALVQICMANGIGTVIPTRDGELGFWSAHADAFASHGIEVVVSSPQAIQLSLDKLLFAKRGAAGSPLLVIPAWLAPEEGATLVVKERFGAGSRSIGINLDQTTARAHASTLNEPIFQPFVQGREVSVDAWLDQAHRVRGLVLRRRDQVLNGESVITTTFRDTSLEAACKAFLESHALRGPVVLQLIVDNRNVPHVIELNARFGGASTAAIAAGLDVWFWTLNERFGIGESDVSFQRIPGEVRQVRVPVDQHFYDPDL